MERDCIVIGGGLGGLFTAALLAHNGLKVTVLEKNRNIGGGLQTFTRCGKSFDAGMHVMGGWQPGGTLDRITLYIGIRDKIKIEPVPVECMDSVYVASTGKEYRIPSDRTLFIDAMDGYFPGSREEVSRYLDAVNGIADAFDLFNLRPIAPGGQLGDLPYEATMAVDEFIARYISNPDLRALLAYINGLYDGCAGRTPAYIHALITALYMKGASRMAGNASSLADALVGIIKNADGEVISGCEVVRIQKCAEGRAISAVIDQNGNVYRGDKYVWAANIRQLCNVTEPGLLTVAYKRRLVGLPVTCSSFGVYIDLIPGVIPYIPHTSYYHDDMKRPWNLSALDSDGIPSGFMYMTPPAGNINEYSDRLVITALMDFAEVSAWAESTTVTRPEAYKEWKKRVADGLIKKLSTIMPELPGAIKGVFTSSPLTVRDTFNAPDGNIYGLSRDCNDLISSQIPVVTKVDNLFLTGQCINLHGICGVPLTALMTAEAILYPRTIIDRL